MDYYSKRSSNRLEELYNDPRWDSGDLQLHTAPMCGIIWSLGLVKNKSLQQEATEKLNMKLFDIYEGMWIQNHFKKFSCYLSALSLLPLERIPHLPHYIVVMQEDFGVTY